MKAITVNNGDIEASIEDDGYGIQLITKRNQYAGRTGIMMTPQLARLTIEVLQQYLNGNLSDTADHIKKES